MYNTTDSLSLSLSLSLYIYIYIKKITTVRLLNIHHHTVTIFVSVMRTFKIYSLNNFKIYNTVLLAIYSHAVRYIPRLIYFIIGRLYFLTISPIKPNSFNDEYQLEKLENFKLASVSKPFICSMLWASFPVVSWHFPSPTDHTSAHLSLYCYSIITNIFTRWFLWCPSN